MNAPLPVEGALAGKYVKSVVTTVECTLALTDEGVVYWFGKNPSSCGDDVSMTPKQMKSGGLLYRRVVAVAAGEGHGLEER